MHIQHPTQYLAENKHVVKGNFIIVMIIDLPGAKATLSLGAETSCEVERSVLLG